MAGIIAHDEDDMAGLPLMARIVARRTGDIDSGYSGGGHGPGGRHPPVAAVRQVPLVRAGWIIRISCIGINCSEETVWLNLGQRQRCKGSDGVDQASTIPTIIAKPIDVDVVRGRIRVNLETASCRPCSR